MVVMPSNRRWSIVASSLYEINKQLKELSEQQELLSIQLKRLCNNESTQCDKWMYIKSERKGPVDYGSIELLKTIDLDQYRKDNVETWKLKAVYE